LVSSHSGTTAFLSNWDLKRSIHTHAHVENNVARDMLPTRDLKLERTLILGQIWAFIAMVIFPLWDLKLDFVFLEAGFINNVVMTIPPYRDLKLFYIQLCTFYIIKL
jgi:hypothetical protein